MYHAFPTLSELGRVSEAEFRAMGLGYRAKFVVGTLQKLQQLGGEEWLAGLRGRVGEE